MPQKSDEISAKNTQQTTLHGRLLTQHLRHCSFCLRGAPVDSPYATSLRKLTQLRFRYVSLAQASYPFNSHKGRFWMVLEDAHLSQKTVGNWETNVDNRRENLVWSNSDLPQRTAGDKCREEQLGEPSKEPFRRRRPRKPKRQTSQFWPRLRLKTSRLKHIQGTSLTGVQTTVSMNQGHGHCIWHNECRNALGIDPPQDPEQHRVTKIHAHQCPTKS